MRKFHVLVILLVCCLAFSVFVGCRAEKEEPAMKTFENKNLSVSYPEGWNTREYGEKENEIVSMSIKSTGDPENIALIEILIRKNYTLPDLSGNPGAKRANEMIDGVDFVTFTETNEANKVETKICKANRNGDTIGILAIYSENNKDLVEKILGTLKFKS